MGRLQSQATILVAGDLAPLGRPEEHLCSGLSKQVFGHILELVAKCDCFVANLECPLTTSVNRLSKEGPNFKCHPEVAFGLSKAGLALCSIANNHIFDYGVCGVQETITSLEKHNIAWYGVGENARSACEPTYMDIKGLRIGFLTYAEHEFNWQSDEVWCTSMLVPAENILQIQHLSEQCDALIVYWHGGPENTHYPSPRSVGICRAFARAGASAVLMSHSHAVMGCEIHQGVPIVYGLGNFLFDISADRRLASRLGILAQLTIRAGQAVNVEIVPVVSDTTTGCVDLLRESRITIFREFYDSISQPLKNAQQIDELWKAFCAWRVLDLARDVARGSAMLAGGLLPWLLRRNSIPTAGSWYRKGANLLRGWTVCENHQDVIGQIFDLLRRSELAQYRRKARDMSGATQQALHTIVGSE
jgi:poly-gamma-glutamate synthesis protein (capsule biosynthesis protein)